VKGWDSVRFGPSVEGWNRPRPIVTHSEVHLERRAVSRPFPRLVIQITMGRFAVACRTSGAATDRGTAGYITADPAPS
jgi:hypothetical protein